jgi:hypothetical protein
VSPGRVRHTVSFTLRHSAGSPRSRREKRLPLRHLDEFADRAAYDGYNEHPAHVQFVAERRVPEVADPRARLRRPRRLNLARVLITIEFEVSFIVNG